MNSFPLLVLILIGYILPVILNVIMMYLFEYLCKKLDRKEDSASDMSPLVFIPGLNWIIICILPIGIIVFGSEYLGELLERSLNKI